MGGAAVGQRCVPRGAALGGCERSAARTVRSLWLRALHEGSPLPAVLGVQPPWLFAVVCFLGFFIFNA